MVALQEESPHVTEPNSTPATNNMLHFRLQLRWGYINIVKFIDTENLLKFRLLTDFSSVLGNSNNIRLLRDEWKPVIAAMWLESCPF